MKPRILFLSVLFLVLPLALAQEKPKVQVYYIPSGAMEPTLNINDRIWTTPEPYQKGDPKRGDIAIMELVIAEVAPWSKEKNKTTDMVKRVVALPGDRVEMVRGVLKVNDKIQKEPFVKWEKGYFYDMKVVGGQVYSREYDSEGESGNWTCKGELFPKTELQQVAISHAKTQALPAKQYLVLGDNRSNSNDSHVFGLVKRSAFKAKVTWRIYPHPRRF